MRMPVPRENVLRPEYRLGQQTPCTPYEDRIPLLSQRHLPGFTQNISDKKSRHPVFCDELHHFAILCISQAVRLRSGVRSAVRSEGGIPLGRQVVNLMANRHYCFSLTRRGWIQPCQRPRRVACVEGVLILAPLTTSPAQTAEKENAPCGALGD